MKNKGMPRVSLAVLMLFAAAESTWAVESLGPGEVVAGVTWTTRGASVAIETGGDPDLKDTLVPNAVGSHEIAKQTMSLLVLDTLKFTYRTLAVDPVDPFWATRFDFEPIELDESGIPQEGATANIPYIGKYGAEGVYASAFYASTGFINGFAFPTEVDDPDIFVINPTVQIDGRTAVIDCCQAGDQRDITYATPSEEGRWLDLDGDRIADVNVEELLAEKGLATGDMTMTFQNGLRSCEILDDLRNQCTKPPTQILATTFAIPLRVVPPSPDQCDLNEDGKFGVADIKLFVQGCKAGTAAWECDIDQNGQFSISDSIRFVLGCGLQPKTQTSLESSLRFVE